MLDLISSRLFSACPPTWMQWPVMSLVDQRTVNRWVYMSHVWHPKAFSISILTVQLSRQCCHKKPKLQKCKWLKAAVTRAKVLMWHIFFNHASGLDLEITHITVNRSSYLAWLYSLSLLFTTEVLLSPQDFWKHFLVQVYFQVNIKPLLKEGLVQTLSTLLCVKWQISNMPNFIF